MENGHSGRVPTGDLPDSKHPREYPNGFLTDEAYFQTTARQTIIYYRDYRFPPCYDCHFVKENHVALLLPSQPNPLYLPAG